MKLLVLLLAFATWAGGLHAQSTRPVQGAEPSKLVVAADPEFDGLRHRYPDLEGAYLVTESRGTIRKAAYRDVSLEQLRWLAEALATDAMTVRGSTWADDPVRARMFATSPSDEVIVLQHFQDGIEVEGSLVIARRRQDGNGDVSSSLIPVSPPATAPLAPRAAAQLALGKTSPMESMSVEVAPELRYLPSPDGVARLAYRATSEDAKGQRWNTAVDVETGEVLRRAPTLVHFDSAPDDSHWTTLDWVWKGQHNGEVAFCVANTLDKTETQYYPKGNELPGLIAQVNLGGPALRLRNHQLGLTSIDWDGKSYQELSVVWPTWSWQDLASRIYNTTFPECQGTYDAPSGYFSPVPFTTEERDQHLQLQTAMQDLEKRFGWRGLNNQYNPLVLVQDIDPLLYCAADIASGNSPSYFAVIGCGRDHAALAAGLPQRIPPIEVFAHEFGHTIINDMGLAVDGDFDRMSIVEALADIFAVSVKAKYGGDPWLSADRLPLQERAREWYCASPFGKEYCDHPPMLALRDLAHPKTMNPIDPGAEYYGGENWGVPHSVTGQGNYHGASQIFSHMMYRVAEGTAAGARDGKPIKGTYDAFSGIGLQEMLEIFHSSLASLPQINSSPFSPQLFASEFRSAAIMQCGFWSRAELVAGKAAWIANLSSENVSFQTAGYVTPQWDEQEVVPLTQFVFNGDDIEQEYEFQVATDAAFANIVHEGKVATALDARGRFLLKLESNTDHWWRIRQANVPMVSSEWVDQDEACWRPAAPFRTGGPAKVTNATPAGATAATGDEVEPWNVVFRWTGQSRFDGYEFWVDDEEPDGGRYAKYWAHKLFDGKQLPLDLENPGSEMEPNFKVPPIPLPSPASGPQNGMLCWEIVPFAYDHRGKRVNGDASEQCFRTREPQTLITHPAPPSADGTLSSAPAQPLAIAYDPADGSEVHDFSLEVTSLTGAGAPPATGAWAYLDDFAHDASNRVKEDPDPADWTSRTRLRTLPVQLDASPYVHYEPGTVRLTIVSRSPAISTPHGGTYPERREAAAPATVDFHPTHSNHVGMHALVKSPPAMGFCSEKLGNGLFMEWDHGADATADRVGHYRVKLYPQRCGPKIGGCEVLGDPASPDFVKGLAFDRTYKHNGQASQRIDFPRAELFPTEADEMNNVTGFLAHLYGVSGPVPGPAGLNVTGTHLVDLPVLPYRLEPVVHFDDGGAAHPEWTRFNIFPVSSKGPEGALRAGQYPAPAHYLALRAYRGATCDENQLISEDADHLSLQLDDIGQEDAENPAVSARVVLDWPGMGCRLPVSECVFARGINRTPRPKPIAGLAAREQGGHLGASWDVPIDAHPETLEYFVGLAAYGNAQENMLVAHPATVQLGYSSLAAIDDQIGLTSLAPLDPSDAGKTVVLRVMACRTGTDKCSDEAAVPYVVGSGAPGTPPASPLPPTIRFAQSASLEPFVGQSAPVFQTGWITASWDAPPGAAPSYYLVSFSATGAVPGVLPNWLGTLGLPGVSYPADPLQYTAVIRAQPAGVVIGDTPWADYVWPLAEIHHAAPPAAGTWVTAKVWACAGNPPLPALKSHDWIVGAETASCSAPAEASAQSP